MPVPSRHPIRALFAILVTGALIAPPSLAQDDDLVPLPTFPMDDLTPLPKLDPKKGVLPASTRRMEVVCINEMSAITPEEGFTGHFSQAEMNTAVQLTVREWLRLSTGPDLPPDVQQKLEMLRARITNLRTCQMYEYTLDLSWRAALSCKALEERTFELMLWIERREIYEHAMNSEQMQALKLMLPAANACRSKLGRCLNPDNKEQQEAYKSLLFYIEWVELLGTKNANEKVEAFYDLPPCDLTMLRDEWDKKPSDDTIKFIETLVIPVTVEYDNTQPDSQDPIIVPVTVEYDNAPSDGGEQ